MKTLSLSKDTKAIATLVLGVLFITTVFSKSALGDASPLFQKKIKLAGEWRFRLDEKKIGRADEWFNTRLPGTIHLPGTTDEAGYGKKTQGAAVGRLTRVYEYVGPAWYQRDFEVPQSWQGKRITLFLERCKWKTTAWIDGKLLGSEDGLSTPHVYVLPGLEPGSHSITLEIDNSLICNIGIWGHSYTEETQSIWNGAVGRIELQATDKGWIDTVRVFPNKDANAVRLEARIGNDTGGPVSGIISGRIVGPNDQTLAEETFSITCNGKAAKVELDLPIAKDKTIQPWNEFTPTLYTAEVSLDLQAGEKKLADNRRETFGFRTIAHNGTHLTLNGRPVFLRGTTDCATYPLTGYPPMDVDGWMRVFRTIQAHGMNHVRYHTWCPPEAAFAAADRLGMILQPETPAWLDGWMESRQAPYPQIFGKNPAVVDFIKRELKRILATYGNHPSFCMFAIGNELDPRGDYDTLANMIAEAKKDDPRRLYSVSTARSLTWADDFLVTHQTPGGKRTRGLCGPQNDWDFNPAVTDMQRVQPSVLPKSTEDDKGKANQYTGIPLIAHEIGQWPVYPNYDEIGKYKGPLRPRTVEAFRDKAAARGLAGLSSAFQQASGRFACLLYKAEMEAILRTPGYAGFQLLQLNDFPGQSEALVGLLDSFWDSKGIVKPDRFREFCCETVPMLRFEKFVWTSEETFEARAQVAHYGPRSLDRATLRWSVTDDDSKIIAKGKFPAIDIAVGKLNDVGHFMLPLSKVAEAKALDVLLEIEGTEYRNRWKIWVFPPEDTENTKGHACIVSDELDKPTLDALASGESVLLLPSLVEKPWSIPGRFMPTYWSAVWCPASESQTLGIICDPQHPALAGFPTEGHSDWQWYDLVKRSRVFVLNNISPDQYTPVIRSISDFHQNNNLVPVFETKVGRGKLMVCGFDLANDIDKRPAARQLLASLRKYVGSERFRPSTTMPVKVLKKMFGLPAAGLRNGNNLALCSARESVVRSELLRFPYSSCGKLFLYIRVVKLSSSTR